MAVALSQGLTLLLLDSNACHVDILDTLRNNGGIGDSITFEATCRISVGAKLVISALCFWLAAGCSSFVAHKAEKEEIVDPLHEPLSA